MKIAVCARESTKAKQSGEHGGELELGTFLIRMYRSRDVSSASETGCLSGADPQSRESHPSRDHEIFMSR